MYKRCFSLNIYCFLTQQCYNVKVIELQMIGDCAMGKIICCMCGKELGFFTGKVVLKDGFVCNSCVKRSQIEEVPDSLTITTQKMVDILSARQVAIQKFRVTKDYGKIKIDTNTQSFMMNDVLYLFENLVSYKYHEDPDNSKIAVKNGKQGGAAIGGVIGGLGGGLVGSAIGAAVGNKVGGLFSSVCNYMYINVTLKDAFRTDVRLTFINEKTRISSKDYTEALKKANECIDALEVIANYNTEKHHCETKGDIQVNVQTNVNNTVAMQEQHMSAAQVAEELKVYKELLEAGLLTQEEFEQKKKQLLALK